MINLNLIKGFDEEDIQPLLFREITVGASYRAGCMFVASELRGRKI
ncbi:MAG: hypothetical protein IJD55_03825 [Clostridia bacterium]|nr:hypothetical protein [Clostridia bacterium]